ncbi:MAG: sensor histidine kinase [Acidimicrobiales bacterium]
MTLTDAHRIRFGRLLAGSGIVMAVGGLVVAILAGRWQAAWDTLTPVNASVGIGFGALAWMILPRQPRNRSVWAYTVAAFFGGLYSTALAVLVLSIPESVEVEQGTLIPADLVWQAAVAATTMSAGWIPSFLLPLTIGLLLFPDGQLPSPRWRWALRFQVASLSLAVLLATAANNPWSTRPIPTPGGTLGTIAEIFVNLALLSALLGVASLVARYRSGDAIIRHQIQWIAFGGALLVTGELLKRVIWGGFTGSTTTTVETIINLVPLILLIGSFWMAVTKYRLYEIDVVISKSVTYLGLGAVITGLYVLVVVGPLLVIGASDDDGPGLLLPILATGAVAIVFEPVRVRMQRLANRLVYGERASPHEVLSQVTARLADATAGSGTDELARLVAEGTGADQAVVWLFSEETFTPDGVWERDGSVLGAPEPVDDVPNDDLTMSKVVVHRDVVFGAVTIVKPRTDPVTPADRELVTDVAAGSGLLLRNLHLNRELIDRAAEVRESRRRLIAAQDAERHRLERDLHDGAQQRVVALKVKLGIARTIADREGAAVIAEKLEALGESVQGAVDDLRAVAHGIYPPLLESDGLTAALRTVERTSTLKVELETVDVERYERTIEETAYFCVTETLERARMSGATTARVGVAGHNGSLITEIDVGSLETELDLRSITDRLDAAGGTLTVEGRRNDGPSIVTSIPVSQLDGVPA